MELGQNHSITEDEMEEVKDIEGTDEHRSETRKRRA